MEQQIKRKRAMTARLQKYTEFNYLSPCLLTLEFSFHIICRCLDEADATIAACHEKIVAMQNEPLPVLKPILDTTPNLIASQSESRVSISMIERRRALKEVRALCCNYVS
jgi:hypothetical protein